MPEEILYSPIAQSDLEELAVVLRNEAVYEHIGGVPTPEDFMLDLQRAMQGPSTQQPQEHWLHFVARLPSTGQMLGRLEATVHDGMAEVAFLYSPQCWGRGYAHQGLLWLHGHLQTYEEVSALWATTVPHNTRCQALLRRCGYMQVSDVSLPPLYSYDIGDWVFSRPVRSETQLL